MRALLLVAALALAPFAHAATVGEEHTCGGIAPEKTGCTTGSHLAILPHHEVRAGEDYTGRLTSIVYHATGSTGETCTFVSGRVTGCMWWSGTDHVHTGRILVEHNCGSEDLDAPRPGGSGTWSCAISIPT